MAIHFQSQHFATLDTRNFSEAPNTNARARKPVTIEGQVQAVTRTQKPAPESEYLNKSSKAAYNLSASETRAHKAQLFEDNGFQPARQGAGVFNRVANYTQEATETRGVLIDTFA